METLMAAQSHSARCSLLMLEDADVKLHLDRKLALAPRGLRVRRGPYMIHELMCAGARHSVGHTLASAHLERAGLCGASGAVNLCGLPIPKDSVCTTRGKWIGTCHCK